MDETTGEFIAKSDLGDDSWSEEVDHWGVAWKGLPPSSSLIPLFPTVMP